ncbi:MAG TPA: MFS transporter [Stellaceae bacterium]|jgi:MFS family permease|nr:MFS transporter [Stellaceae bacterium]
MQLRRTAHQDRSIVTLMPIMAVVLVAFLVIGLALPVLPLHVHNGLGLGPFIVGLVAGTQFVASLISRPWAGHYADRSGAKRAVVAGLLVATVSGLLYLLSLRFVRAPQISVTILLLGRALLGGAESFVITGAVSWGLALVSPQNTGKVIAWVGAPKQATPAQIALAWLLAQKPWIVPIPGTTKLHRLEENLGAASVELTPDDLRTIDSAVSKITLQEDRCPPHLAQRVGR